MDMKIEAAAMVAEAGTVDAVVTVVRFPILKVALPTMAVASSSCLDILRYSIDAVAPNHILRKELALA